MAVQGGSFGPIRAQQHDRRRIAVRVNVLVPSMREVLTGLAERRLGGSWRPASPRSRWWSAQLSSNQ